MANFLLIADADLERRAQAIARARDEVAFLPRLQRHFSATPCCSLVWAAAPLAPVDLHRGSTQTEPDCILFGEPQDAENRLVTAAAIAARHRDTLYTPPELNGYVAAIVAHPRLGIRVEADVLGVFPIYYWQRDGVLLVATSPALFKCHPCFQSALDLHGVASLLLTSGIAAGHTLWSGVRRLTADHVLICPPGGAVRELAPPQPVDDAPPNPAEAARTVAELHHRFLAAALKPARQPGLLLSGGLDSRILAGMTTALGYRPQCLTFGRTDDLDARCATLVARELDLPQTLCDVPTEDYLTYAASSVTWEQLSGGLYAIPMGWNLSVSAPAAPIDRMVCGLTLDAVIGGPKHVAVADRDLSFENLRIGRLGFTRAQLDALVAAPELHRACKDVRGHLVDAYCAGGAANHVREWRMNLAHRQRFAVGSCAWRYAFFAWPVMPALDRRLIRLAAQLPYEAVENRRVQKRILIEQFPRLAQLELDRNYHDTTPLMVARASRGHSLRRRLVKLSRRIRGWIGPDPRFYVRTMEFNSPGWRAVRGAADQARAGLRHLFHSEALAEQLPPARVTVRRLADPIIDSTPLKTAVGLMLWMRQHG